jgi:hypothetical protein
LYKKWCGGIWVERIFNVHEALQILKRHYITGNIQMVSNFIREGRLKGERASRKEGWMIKEYDLYDFIDEEKPGIVEIVYVYDKYSESVSVPTSEEFLFEKSRRIQLLLENDKECKEKKRVYSDEVRIDNTTKDLLKKLSKDVNEIREEVKGIKSRGIPKAEKKSSLPINKDEKKKSIKINNYEPKTFEDFKALLKSEGIITDIEMESHQEEIKIVYYVYYDQVGKISNEIRSENGFKSKLLKDQTQKTFLPFIKNTFKALLQKAKDNEIIINEDGIVEAVNQEQQEVKDSDKSQEEIDGAGVRLKEREIK